MKELGGDSPRTTDAFALLPRKPGNLNPRVCLLLGLLLAGPLFCRAQDDGQKQADSSTKPSGRKRTFGLMPAYGIVDEGMHPPALNAGQKFGLATQYIDPYTFVFVAAEAGINQASNSPREYGQGAEGFGKRYGAEFADGLTNSIFTTGVYPSLLRQDPRYYRRGSGAFFNRAVYAASRVLVTRQDSQRQAFNFSEILGNLTSASIAITYYPASQRDFSDVGQRAGVQLGFDAGFNLLKEFYPDIQRKFFDRKSKSRPRN
jgi:hypothetical protein